MPLFRRKRYSSISNSSPSSPGSATISTQVSPSSSSTEMSISSSSYPLSSSSSSSFSSNPFSEYRVPKLFQTVKENFKYRWGYLHRDKRIRARILLQYGSHALLWWNHILSWENPWLTFAVGYLWTMGCYFYNLIYLFAPGWVALMLLIGYIYVHFSFFPKDESSSSIGVSPSFQSTQSSVSSSTHGSPHWTHPKNQTPPSLLESTRELGFFTYTITQQTSDVLVYLIDLFTWEVPSRSHHVLGWTLALIPVWWLLHWWFPANYVLCGAGWGLLISQHPYWLSSATVSSLSTTPLGSTTFHVPFVAEEKLTRPTPLSSFSSSMMIPTDPPTPWLPPRLPAWIEQIQLPNPGPFPSYIRGLSPSMATSLSKTYHEKHHQHVTWAWEGPWTLSQSEATSSSPGSKDANESVKRVWIRKALCIMR